MNQTTKFMILKKWGGVILILFCVLLLSFSFSLKGFIQNVPEKIDSLQYPKGCDTPVYSALEQLKRFPPPRYAPHNKLMRLFNWMDPLYLGSAGQPGVNRADAIKRSVDMQEELALNWNYNIVLPNTISAWSDAALKPNTAMGSFIELANKYPDIPLGVITFWVQLNPSAAKFTSNHAMILSQKLDDRFYLAHSNSGKERKVINYYFPDSLIEIDGHTQKYYLSNILSKLTRPINLINENGEEPPGAELLKRMKSDSGMIHLKDSLKISSWKDFISIEKLHMRKKYVSCFMDELPELKNTLFSCYTVEAGPIDRFAWYIMKKILTPVNGNYYSTPDFYPRTPDNWKEWRGPWHGWKWIADGRKIESKAGDQLFSPYVCAGWSNKASEDIRPAQWLGLLKCLSAAGAEFFYVGYFNLKAPFNDPSQYIWQAAIASYAQAITSRFEDELRNGHFLKGDDGEPLISIKTNYPNVLLVVRKHNLKERYLICATIQPSSNNKGDVPDKKNITVEFDGQKLTFEARRQGSVYIYDKTNDEGPVFYQLDSWHESAHPDHWSNDFYFEAEVQDGEGLVHVITERKDTVMNDFSNSTSYVRLSTTGDANFHFTERAISSSKKYIAMRIRSKKKNMLSIILNGKCICTASPKAGMHNKWEWTFLELPEGSVQNGSNELSIQCTNGQVDLDKVVVTDKMNFPANYPDQ